MKIFICDNLKGHYPVGVAAIVCAETEEQAIEMLTAELIERGLPQEEPVELSEIERSTPYCRIINDGNY